MTAALKYIYQLLKILTDDGKTLRRIFGFLAAVLCLALIPAMALGSIWQNEGAQQFPAIPTGKEEEIEKISELSESLPLDESRTALLLFLCMFPGEEASADKDAFYASLSPEDTRDGILEKARIYLGPGYADPGYVEMILSFVP